MGRYILVATGGIREGGKTEYDSWHDDVHIPDICKVPGVKSGRRFVAHAATPAKPTNMAIYEIETEDPVAVLAEIGNRVGSGEFVISGAVDPEGAGMTLFEECGRPQ